MRRTIHFTTAETAHGPVAIAASEKGVCWLSFDTNPSTFRERFPRARIVHGGELATGLERAVASAIDNPSDKHRIPLDLHGTDFQCSVWDMLLTIPAGETRSYADLARALGKPNATRAVGAANGQNPVAVLVPCHRVIASDGTLGGYAGGLPLKQALLAGEGARFVRELEQPLLF